MNIVRWLTSGTFRRATAMASHVEKLLAAQRDVLSPPAIQAVTEAIASLRQTLGQGADNAVIVAQMDNLEKVGNEWLKTYPNAAWRENVEVFLVAIAVAMAIRSFFLQPFKIPTGSMQPTLFGITDENLLGKNDVVIPNALHRFFSYWKDGVTYVHVVAKAGGTLESYEAAPKRLLLFNLYQRFQVGGQTYTVWFPPEDMLQRAGLLLRDDRDGTMHRSEKEFKPGEDLIRLKVLAGDHLFVNRIVFNFCHPQRGDIIVFSTKGIDPEAANHWGVDRNQYYIKRLVALGGEHVLIGDDQHLVINGKRLDSSTPNFENVYNFHNQAGDNQYFGHTHLGMLYDANQEFTVQTNHYMVMGDNTRHSLDSRFFGDFSQEFVIGKASFVYWPLSSRFGWGYQ